MQKKRGRPTKAESEAKAAAAAGTPVQTPPLPAPVQTAADERAINANAITNTPLVKPATKAPVAATGIRLFINCVPSEKYEPLDGYMRQLTKSMEEKFSVADVRAAPDANHPLAYARWKGVLAALVRNELPSAGDYAVFTEGNEIAQVVAEALTPVAGFVVRGVR